MKIIYLVHYPKSDLKMVATDKHNKVQVELLLKHLNGQQPPVKLPKLGITILKVEK